MKFFKPKHVDKRYFRASNVNEVDFICDLLTEAVVSCLGELTEDSYVEAAHKLKGEARQVGFMRLGYYAQKVQEGGFPVSKKHKQRLKKEYNWIMRNKSLMCNLIAN